MNTDEFDTTTSTLIRNVVVLGSNGSGKSSTCNTLFGGGEKPFAVGHDELSCTKDLCEHFSDSKKIRIFDTPSFGDTRFGDRRIDRTLRQLNSIFSDSKERSSKVIDAFLLVFRLSPRATTLRSDLDKIKEIFGSEALKSVILLPIYSEKTVSSELFLEKLSHMDEVVRLLKEAKEEEPSEDWFCVWDNLNPREGQETELLQKMRKLRLFTEPDFEEATRQSQRKSSIKAKLDADGDALFSKTDIGSTIEDIDERRTGRSQTHSGAFRKDSDESLSKVMEVIELKHLNYTKQLHEFLVRNGEMMEKYIGKVEEMSSRNPEQEANRHIGQLFLDFACKRRKVTKAEKKELVGATVKQGAKQGAKVGAEKGAETIVKTAANVVVKEGGKKLVKAAVCQIF